VPRVILPRAIYGYWRRRVGTHPAGRFNVNVTYSEEVRQHVQEFIAAETEAMTPDDTVDSVLIRLRERGATAIEAIKVVDALFSLKYPAGKIALHRSPAWADITRNAERLHDAASEAARRLSDDRWISRTE